MTIAIGIIAEDDSDIEVLKILIGHYKRPRQHKFHHVSAGGCARILSKCRAWAENLKNKGCTRLIIVQDSDGNNPQKLQAEIIQKLNPSPINLHVVVIPVRELEAWLLADADAIRSAFKIKTKVKKVTNPEAIHDAKKRLRDEISKWTQKKVRYINTVDNKKIAAACNAKALCSCASYVPLDNFIKTHC